MWSVSEPKAQVVHRGTLCTGVLKTPDLGGATLLLKSGWLVAW